MSTISSILLSICRGLHICKHAIKVEPLVIREELPKPVDANTGFEIDDRGRRRIILDEMVVRGSPTSTRTIFLDEVKIIGKVKPQIKKPSN